MTLHLRPPPDDATEATVLRWGLEELATMPPGSHGDASYAARREVKEYASAILDAADRAAYPT